MSMAPCSLVDIRAHTVITQKTTQYVFTAIKCLNILLLSFIRIKILKDTPARSSVTQSISIQNYTMNINKTYTGRTNTKTGAPNLILSHISVTPNLPEGKTELRSFYTS